VTIEVLNNKHAIYYTVGNGTTQIVFALGNVRAGQGNVGVSKE
jgi:hypothetical protein